MNAIKNWDFSNDLDKIAPREALARQTVCRFKQYLKVADAQCTDRKKIPRDRRYPAPLIDEQIWTFLVAYGYRDRPSLLFEMLTGRPHPDPSKCHAWLEMLPMPARRGGDGGGSEGNSNIDLIVGSIDKRGKTGSGVQYWPSGPVCLLEAKWKSDISGYTSHDPHRNQLARVIETAVTLQYHQAIQANQAIKVHETAKFGAMPEEVYVTLLTPAVFKTPAPPWSRFYACKFHEYNTRREALIADITQQEIAERQYEDHWKYPGPVELERRLGAVQLRWITYEELLVGIPDLSFRSAMAEFVRGQPELQVGLLDKGIFP